MKDTPASDEDSSGNAPEPPEDQDEPLDPAEEGPVGGGYTGGIRHLVERDED